MNTPWAIIIAVGFGLVVAVPFWSITMNLNRKQWAWEESGKYLRSMNRASWVISAGLFLLLGSLAFFVCKAVGGEFT